MRRQPVKTRDRVIQAVSAPLGFFVLALLIVEAFLASVLIGGSLERADKMLCVWIGVALFGLVTMTVFILVWSKPENLTFDKEAHLARGNKAPFGSDTKTVADRDALPVAEAAPPEAP